MLCMQSRSRWARWMIAAQGLAGHWSADDQQLHCASPVFLGFLSLFCHIPLLVIIIMIWFYLLNYSSLNPQFLLLPDYPPPPTERMEEWGSSCLMLSCRPELNHDTLLVSPCQLVSSLLVCRHYFHSNIHTLRTMYIAFEIGIGKKTRTWRNQFQRESRAELVHMEKICPNTWKKQKVWDLGYHSSLGPQQIWCCLVLHVLGMSNQCGSSTGTANLLANIGKDLKLLHSN